MKFLIDMNLTPEWCGVLRKHGWEAVHWSHVGDPRAADRTIMIWARTHGYVVFTHDLDFGILLALTNAGGPSVIQARTQDVSPQHLEAQLVGVLRDHEAEIEAGALITIDEIRSRVRILPLDERR